MDDSLNPGDSPATGTPNPQLQQSHLQNTAATSPSVQDATPTADEGDVSMTEAIDNAAASGTNNLPPGSSSTPAPASDNPLDAPEAPRPQDEKGTGPHDAEMGTTETGKENGNAEKNGGEGQAAAEETAADGQPAQTKAALESSARSHLISQTHAIILPSYSTWFDMHNIHTLEKKALPEFFNNRNRSKTAAVYKDYRDFMVNTYRLNPAEYLTVTACRRNLAGDVCAIMRVHSFLEQWGLINYQVDPDTRPSSIGPPFTGHFRVTADTPRGLQPFQPTPNPVITSGKPFAATDRAASATPVTKADLNLEIRRNIYDQQGKDISSPRTKEKQANGESTTNGTPVSGEAGTKSLEELMKEPKKQFHCYTCGVDCTRVRYHSAKTPPSAVATTGSAAAKLKYDLCPNCFVEGRFPGTSHAVDFVKLEDPFYSAIPDRDAPWTDAELLLLTEGLELFDDNWGSIADHVGTRTREQCFLKFLSAEIDDIYRNGESAGDGSDTFGTLTGKVPFTQADNPVMSVIGFLGGLSSPDAAAAAVKKSRKDLQEGLHKQVDHARAASGTAESSEKDQEKGKEKEGMKHEDSMDVDSAEQSQPQQESEPSQQDQQVATNSAQSHSQSTDPASAAALALAGIRAGALVSHEEREMTRLVSAAVNTTLQKFELKLRQFSEMEAILQSERRELERGRQQLFLDRLAFKKRVREVQEGLKAASLSGGEEGARMAEEVANAKGGQSLVFESGDVDGEEGEKDAKPLSAETPGYRTLEI
ncbi:MAG: hypothetical protein M1819_005298 [Sarea resinae]|nr:MAG: hypothetical protein M1819_005298 [Sarea resinae]